jgi:hypothetical protein
MTETEARDAASRWGQLCGEDPLMAFAQTGLIEDRKRLLDAIQHVRHFLKFPDEIDLLRDYVQQMTPQETAARREGWTVVGGRIWHVHDYDRSVSYKSWQACCEGEDIIAEAE